MIRRLLPHLIGRDPHNDLSRLDRLDGVTRCESILANIAERRVTAGIAPRRHVPQIGEHVTVSWRVRRGDDVDEEHLDGWLLPAPEGWVRIAASPDDDGTGDADDFMRAAFPAEDVRVTAW